MAKAMGFASFGTNKVVREKKEKVKEMRAYEVAQQRKKLRHVVAIIFSHQQQWSEAHR
jgi:hypothetical protein